MCQPPPRHPYRCRNRHHAAHCHASVGHLVFVQCARIPLRATAQHTCCPNERPSIIWLSHCLNRRPRHGCPRRPGHAARVVRRLSPLLRDDGLGHLAGRSLPQPVKAGSSYYTGCAVSPLVVAGSLTTPPSLPPLPLPVPVPHPCMPIPVLLPPFSSPPPRMIFPTEFRRCCSMRC